MFALFGTMILIGLAVLFGVRDVQEDVEFIGLYVEFDEGEDRIDRRGRGVGDPAEFLDRAHERVDLHRAARVEVLKHGGPVRAHRRAAVDAAVDVDRELHPQRLGHRLELL